jgi:PAS domain S-box-containing protein
MSLVIDPNGTVLAANAALATRRHTTMSELIGRCIYDLNPPNVAKVVRSYHQEAIRTKGPLRFELEREGRLYESTVYPIADKTGQVRKLVIQAYDITERKRAEETLRHYRLLASNARDIILFVRRRDGRIIEANEAATKAYGYRQEELLGMTIYDLRGPESYALTDAQMDKADSEGILFETQHVRKDGTVFPVEVNSRGISIDGPAGSAERNTGRH